MAKFNATLDASLFQLEQLSDEEKWDMLEPAAQLARDAYSDAIRSTFDQHTGSLAQSPTVEQKMKDGQLIARISLKGKHPGTGTGIRMKKDKNGRRKSGHYSGTNAEVGYYLNYGTPRIRASHWFDNANDRTEAQVQDKIEEGWNAYLDSKGV